MCTTLRPHATALGARDRDQRVADRRSDDGLVRERGAATSTQVMRPRGREDAAAPGTPSRRTRAAARGRGVPGEALEQPSERDAHLHAREVMAGAEVRPETEGGVVPRGRNRSKSSAVGPKTSSSRFADETRSPRFAPAGTVTPPSSTSTSARRVCVPIGETQRSPSSIASRTRSGRRSPRGAAATRAARRASCPRRARAPACRRAGSP